MDFNYPGITKHVKTKPGRKGQPIAEFAQWAPDGIDNIDTRTAELVISSRLGKTVRVMTAVAIVGAHLRYEIRTQDEKPNQVVGYLTIYYNLEDFKKINTENH